MTIDIKNLDMNGIEFIEDKDYFIIKRYGKYFRLGVPEANMLRELTVHRDVQTVLRKYGISEEDFSKFVHALEECGVIGDVKKERKNIRRVDYPIKSKGYRKKSTFPVECE